MSDAVKGKNFSKANRGQRNKNDFYQTPYSMTEQLIEKLCGIRMKTVLEPACGKMAIANVLDRFPKQFPDVQSYDLEEHGLDFMAEPRRFDWIITNPPLSISLDFIQQCKKVARKGFWLLMPIEYLHGQERFEKVYNARDGYPLKHVYIFTRRAMMADTLREDGCYPTGMVTWAWYGWTRMPFSHRFHKPEIDWIDNNRFVLRKKNQFNITHKNKNLC